jgi:hypothetical protein
MYSNVYMYISVFILHIIYLANCCKFICVMGHNVDDGDSIQLIAITTNSVVNVKYDFLNGVHLTFTAMGTLI